ncbi:oral-facial-digital syndrome 1 protein homolog [Dendronephthya gigantea]|uniref:oral-facial-digital syndrome 1 protein homolog n=1 Tax=Dendronephthya gigantea TaxID=151771 RepID=UPI00106D20AD|nr:oral-facial-digital syndrome 1 protein homolog [Dendronephthya gigantea]
MTTDLSAEDVKNKLFHSLKTRGVLDSLKSQLRKQLIEELQDTTGIPVLHPKIKTSPEVESGEAPLFQRAANSIVAEYLKKCHFEYTLSTFLPESGTSVDKMFSSKEILQLLNIDHNSKLHHDLEQSLSSRENSKGFLWHFLGEIAASQNRLKCDVDIQTEDILSTQISSSLEERLSSVEKEYFEKQKLVQLDKNQGLEERLLAMQKKYEEQKKNELEQEVKAFRAGELSRLRMEERQKYEAKISAIRLEYVEEFNAKNQALRALEKEMLERIRKLQEVHQSEAYGERQKFLDEIRTFKEREADLKNRTLMQERSQKLEKERLINEAEKIKAREDSLKEKEKLQSQRFDAEIESFKSNYEKNYLAKSREFLRQETRLEAERSKLDGEREEHLKCKDELSIFKEKCLQLQSTVDASHLLLEDLKLQKENLEKKLTEMKDYQTLKKKEIILTKDIEHLTQRLTESNIHCKEQEKRHHKLVKDLTEKTGRPSKEIMLLQQELEEAKNKFHEKEKTSYKERKSLEIQLESQIQRANHFQKTCEEQLNTQRFLETEIENLKMMQEQTERLLNMELRHHAANNSNMSSSRRNQSGQKASRRKILHEQDVSLPQRPLSTRIPERGHVTEESSTMDESSLASLIEDKKSFEKFEREAAALDASYRDFQSRMTVHPKYSVTSIPNSMTFRRLASYHSLHSPPPMGTNFGSEGFSLASQRSKDEFRPLKQVYDESDVSGLVRHPSSAEMENSEKSTRENNNSDNQRAISHEKSFEHSDSDAESGVMNEDHNDLLSMNDLNPVDLPAGSFNSKERIDVSKDKGAMENIKLRGKTSSTRLDNESDDLLKAQSISQASFHNNDGFLDQTEDCKAEKEVNLLNINQLNKGLSPTDKKINTAEGFDGCNVRQHFKEGKLDNVGEGKEKHVTDEDVRSCETSQSSEKSLSHGPLHVDQHTSSYSVERHQDSSSTTKKHMNTGVKIYDDKRPSTELDMEEIEERRLRETENLRDEGQNGKNDTISRESSPNVGGKSEDISSNGYRSSHEASVVEENVENNENDPPIDPVMLQYMEMIKQQRESEKKTSEKISVDVSADELHDFSDKGSHVSIGKDEDLSIGKLSDDDFNW